ncbi:zinc-dependent alcohol dehydrogenase family protein [Terrihalobacillus insolitus]|uniref:zinc-dependent alcohol dehydrogenase family protein n=1 Tax=Terrihalobacillus insolitus TaxID=2950438 RepID=UPI002341F6C0|nr:zinc-dependent alcohol dehydrogenase family protein [Terrihalobacillus insolitus]MDC3414486.1 zinc-dependent alcohol dehydrogenase family protein [Terrihalobacillus insolitus]
MEAKSVKFYEFGIPKSVLKIEKRNIQPPLKGEVLVRMKVRPINPSDLIPIRGAYSHRISLPTVPGYEGVGIVEDAGEDVSRQLIGRRVLPLRGEGTWQEFVKTSAELAIPIPVSIDDFVASQLYINPITAWVVCTDVLKLKPGDTLIVNAGGSSISRIFAQLSIILGFQMIAVMRNDNYTNELIELGASYVVNTSETSLHSSVMELTNGCGATSAIDSVGGVDGTELAFCVRHDGNFLTIGLLSGTPIDWKSISQKTKVNVKLFHLRHWNRQVSVQTWQKTFEHLITLINERKLTLMMKDSQYDLLQINEAVGIAESSKKNIGKVFLTS